MAATYVKDQNGTVHLVDPTGDGEFTFCNRDYVQAVDGGFDGSPASGPCTCPDCRVRFDEMRDAMRGVRWATD